MDLSKQSFPKEGKLQDDPLILQVRSGGLLKIDKPSESLCFKTELWLRNLSAEGCPVNPEDVSRMRSGTSIFVKTYGAEESPSGRVTY